MHKMHKVLLIFLAVLSLILSSCKKDREIANESPENQGIFGTEIPQEGLPSSTPTAFQKSEETEPSASTTPAESEEETEPSTSTIPPESEEETEPSASTTPSESEKTETSAPTESEESEGPIDLEENGMGWA